jgi:hypothetical protein
MRIGFTGFAESGKDVAASALVKHRGFVKVNMSDALLRDLKILNPYVKLDDYVAPRIQRLNDWLEVFNYEELKAASADFRELLQRYGTDVWRSVDEDTWVRRAAQQADLHERVVTTGVRFLNEMRGIDVLVWVHRPGYGPVNGHVSDAGMREVIALADYTLENDGTVYALSQAALDLVDFLIPPTD